ncbi:condensation domain-containing protein, partial [Enterobacter hormaechei subsp. steigerwaltii]|nr:condensation domain-containing protein [Enterobacter hormaechei subsp. steigerwaltii]
AQKETGGENPGGENPGGENPGGENPGGANPGGENPGGENPGGENPGGENPGGENPGSGKPGIFQTVAQSSNQWNTAGALSTLQLRRTDEALPPIEAMPRGAALPLSFAQQRLWFLTQLEGLSETYHIPLALSLRGELDLPAWRQSLDALYARHEALRSRFVTV